jgi:hypothetical protein
MRKRLTWTLALGAAVAIAVAGIATAAKPTIVRAGNLILTLNGDFSPKQLPKNKLAGISLNISGKIATADGTHPPAMRKVVVLTDKNGTINAKGLPVCTSGKLQAQDTKHAEKACPTAIVGEGKATAEVAFPEQNPIPVSTKLLAFNGGVKGGTTTIFIHAYFSAPVSGAIVTTVKIKKTHQGRFGTESIATIPQIAGGSGSTTSFTLTFKRKFTYKGKKQDYLLAKCPDGHLDAHATAFFQDGTKAAGDFTRSCTPKG